MSLRLRWWVGLPLLGLLGATEGWNHGLPPHMTRVPAADEVFLEELERRCFRFFWEQANPANGLIADRARADGSEPGQVCSIASVGFGLTGLCIADARGWIPRAAAYRRVLTTLRHFWEKQEHVHGFYYHFLDMKTGARVWDCELSSIDTALLMAGVLTARQYYRGTEVERLATRLYERVDWDWMRNGGDTLTMGWTPEYGFLQVRWDGYSEHMLLYLLALGSRTKPLPSDTWMKWKREPVITYGGRTYLQCPPLFTHQYSQAWVDFRHRRDAVADYWHNSVLATLSHRDFCYDIGYATNLWGITASDSPTGYRAWGGPPKTPDVDGTVVPCAAGGSLPFAPAECLAALRAMQPYTWTRYGYADAFHPKTGWVNPDVIGIDVGITLLMAENYRTGFVWHYFMRNPEIRRAMSLAGFRRTAPNTSGELRYLRALARDTWRGIAVATTRGRVPADSAGLYVTAVVAAHELGLIRQAEAERRIARVLDDGVDGTLEAAGSRAMWAAGLATAGQAFPRFGAECERRIRAMRWSDGMNDGARPDGGLRLATFCGIASGELSTGLWSPAHATVETEDLLAGYETGLWLDERDTRMSRAAHNAAYRQMSRGFPWGWCPRGSRAHAGDATGPVVYPHLSVLAIEDFPQEVVANLRELERRAARHERFGFYAALDLATGRVEKDFRLADQCRILVSLANHLQRDAVRRHFQAAPWVQRGRHLIVDYREPYYRDCSLYTLERRPPSLTAP